MKRLAQYSIILLLLTGTFAHAATIRLHDGSVINGDIASFKNGTYVVDSPSVGRVEIRQQDVDVIEYGSSDRPKASAASGSDEIERLQKSLINDASMMAMIQGLAADPEIQEVLADPEIRRAIAAQDVNALMANKKFMRLMNNANMQAVTKEAMGRQ